MQSSYSWLGSDGKQAASTALSATMHWQFTRRRPNGLHLHATRLASGHCFMRKSAMPCFSLRCQAAFCRTAGSDTILSASLNGLLLVKTDRPEAILRASTSSYP